MDTLRRICAEDSIFGPTFPLTKMSPLELEYAATGTQRLYKSIKDRGSTPLAPLSARVLRPPDAINIKLRHGFPGNFRETYLTPGGRFLVTMSWNWMAVWDLAIDFQSDEAIQNVQPIAVVPVLFRWMSLVHPTPDQHGLRIFISHLGPNADNVNGDVLYSDSDGGDQE